MLDCCQAGLYWISIIFTFSFCSSMIFFKPKWIRCFRILFLMSLKVLWEERESARTILNLTDFRGVTIVKSIDTGVVYHPQPLIYVCISQRTYILYNNVMLYTKNVTKCIKKKQISNKALPKVIETRVLSKQYIRVMDGRIANAYLLVHSTDVLAH